jgi:hypothetical protein
MDNKLNEIRRKISLLRADMLSLQGEIRVLVNRDLDCSESSLRLTAMRAEMLDLIRRRNAMGGIEACPNIAERLKQNYRPELRRRTLRHKNTLDKKNILDKSAAAREKPGRSRALSI